MSSNFNKTSAQVREAFLKYFEKNGHTRVASGSLIPSNDPTLLFTNAGMVPFKDCFLGLEKRPYTRATSVQKCVRAGGKHNDLENVGFTARHHTFFEMLGNFSFGDYFKREAIHFAWEFVTKEIGLPTDRLRVSVFEKDDEAAEIWRKDIGLSSDRIVRFGEKDNFWSMGDTGPCGPCSEIFWDQGQEVDGDRWLEFWNCVFMQFDRSADGKMTPLPKPSVDTGMGLERMCAILQGVPSNYDIDLFANIIRDTQKKAKLPEGLEAWQVSALRVIADHLRSTSFLIADGVLPSNEGRGYVLRRILRRAVRFQKRLGVEEPLMTKLFASLQREMSGAYPELNSRAHVISEILEQEESKFYETLDRGLHILDEAISKGGSSKVLPAEIVFKLYDTYGFPSDLTALIAREKGFQVNEAEFEKLMHVQQERSRANWKGSGAHALPATVREWKAQGLSNQFVGYEKDAVESAKVLATAAGENKTTWICLEPTPFYPEGGGQASDQGWVEVAGQKLRVLDSQKVADNLSAVCVEVASSILAQQVGKSVKAFVDVEKRSNSRAHHTATHLLHAALRKVLGGHVTQAGSLVSSERLRFDYSHGKSLSAQELQAIEDLVNHEIQRAQPVQAEHCSYDQAMKKGAMALFSEKYGDQVRVISAGDFSTELCGGLHVANTRDIQVFKIVSDSAVASGTRRVEALAASAAWNYYKSQEAQLLKSAEMLKVVPDQIDQKIEKLLKEMKAAEDEIQSLKKKLASGATAAQVMKGQFNGLSVQVHKLADADSDFLKNRADVLRAQESSHVHVLLGKELCVIACDPKTLKGAHAGQLMKALAEKLGAKGGGQEHMAQGRLPLNDSSEAQLKSFFGIQ